MTHLRSLWELVSSRRSCFPLVSLLSCRAIISLRISANFYTAVGHCFTPGISKDQQQTTKFLPHSKSFSGFAFKDSFKVELWIKLQKSSRCWTSSYMTPAQPCLYAHAAYLHFLKRLRVSFIPLILDKSVVSPPPL